MLEKIKELEKTLQGVTLELNVQVQWLKHDKKSNLS